MNDMTAWPTPEVVTECRNHIEAYWDRVTVYSPNDNGTQIGLPYPYVVSNHEMFRELYYWDSYFIAVGLVEGERERLVVDMTLNLLSLVGRFGRIPNASRFYHLSRSQPPFLSSLVLMTLEILKRTKPNEADAFLARAFALVKQEYHSVWRMRKFPDHREVVNGLSRYYDLNIWHNAAEAESGWDMTPRFDDRCLDFLAVDLNSLLLKYEEDLCRIADMLGEITEREYFQIVANERKRRITDQFWCEQEGFFFDFDYKHGKRSTFRSLAGFFPLWAGAASKEQAQIVVEKHLGFFETEYGLVTTEEWHPLEEQVPKQWAWPNGWAPLHWIAIEGLMHYGYHSEAQRIATKWLGLVASVFKATGCFYEKYDVVHGCRARADRYPDQEGFGWTNAIFLKLTKLFGR